MTDLLLVWDLSLYALSFKCFFDFSFSFLCLKCFLMWGRKVVKGELLFLLWCPVIISIGLMSFKCFKLYCFACLQSSFFLLLWLNVHGGGGFKLMFWCWTKSFILFNLWLLESLFTPTERQTLFVISNIFSFDSNELLCAFFIALPLMWGSLDESEMKF